MEKILVVDDQRNMRTTLAIMLRGAGYVVDEASSGEAGGELGATGAFDLVITDLRMGSSNGIDTDRFRPASEGRSARLCQQLGIPDDAPVVGFVGRLTRDKGIGDLSDV